MDEGATDEDLERTVRAAGEALEEAELFVFLAVA